jgi:catechol 2,3-dioxygenase-like lactoylglutathione lyase family enzyme
MPTVARALASIDNLDMKILFIASVSIITRDPKISSRLFVDALGLPLQQDKESDYIYSEKIEGSKHFGVWPLSDAAQACFGRKDWPTDRPIPQASVEFEVEDAESVASAAAELESKGYVLLHASRTEPWKQIIARLQTPEGAIIGISYASSLHK